MRSLIVLLTLLTFTPTATAGVPWEKVPGVDRSKVTDGIRSRALALMKQENCYFDCPESVLVCAEKGSPTALRMTGVILRLLLEGKKDAEIRKELKNRARSAHPFRKAKIDLSDTPMLGSAGAKVKIVIWADFDCPYCHVVSPRLKAMLGEFKGQVSLYFKLFPVKAHGPTAVRTSMAGWAAHLQGKFWEFHDKMYKHFEDHSDGDMIRYAGELGMDTGRFKSDMDKDSTRDTIRSTKRTGVKLGVKSTPSLYINGKRYYGLKTESELRDRIQEELELSK